MSSTPEIDLKRKIIEASEAVRKKYYTIKNRELQSKGGLEEFYKPVTTHLKAISNIVKTVTPQNVNLQSNQISNVIPTSSKKIRTEATTKQKYNEESEILDESSGNTSYENNVSLDQKTQDDLLLNSNLFSTPLAEQNEKKLKSTRLNFSDAQIDTPHTLSMNYVKKIKNSMTGFDVTYGIRVDSRNKLHMGNTQVRFPPGEISFWRGNSNVGTYPVSAELLDLIFLKQPAALTNLTSNMDDVNKIYRDILLKTNAIFNQYNGNRGINQSKSKKFLTIIKPLIQKSGNSLNQLPINRKLNFKQKQFVYWDSATELVSRLKLLWSSKLAGNTAHDNEIISIIEELREANIIF